MQYSILAITAIIASLSAVTEAAPKGSGPLAENIYFGNKSVSITSDDVYRYLENAGKIQWKQAGSGRVTEIPEDVWKAGIAGAESNKTTAARDFHDKRNYHETLGDIAGYAAKVSCYGSGALDTDGNIVNAAVEACDHLIDSTAPALVKGAIKTWQSGQLPDANGKTSFIKFSTKLLVSGFSYDNSICQTALQQFNSYCQKKVDDSQGGQITIGNGIMFGADPTDP